MPKKGRIKAEEKIRIVQRRIWIKRHVFASCRVTVAATGGQYALQANRKRNPPLGYDESKRRVVYLIWVYDTSRA